MKAESASNAILCGPFLSQPLSFRFVANRAISLFAILSVKRVAVLAMGFCCVLGANALAVFERVLSFRNKSQVFRIHAIPVTTQMVDHHVFRNVSNRTPINEPMHPSIHPSEEKRSVPVSVKRAGPEDAATFPVFSSGQKSRQFHFSHAFHMAQCMPYSS